MSERKPNILVYRPSGAEAYADFLRNNGLFAVETASSADEAISKLPGIDVLFCWKFPTQLLSSPEASSVRWIQSMGAGVDDLVADPHIPKHIAITRILEQFGGPIAEYVFAYLLYLTKQIETMRTAQANRLWNPFLTGFLAGKTIGVAGLGSIGLEVVRKARAFDMNVHGLSLTGKSAGIVDRHYTGTEWKDFVAELDYLVLTLPLTDQTRHAVNREILFSMKPDASLINVGRGQLICEADLIHVITEGHLNSAVLDVFEQEPLDAGSPLWSFPNVFVTPHLSGPSMAESVCQFFLKNLQSYCDGMPLNGLVDRKLGY